MKEILTKLGISKENYGANFSDWWSTTETDGLIKSYCPNNEELLASVFQCSLDDYEHIIQESQKSFNNALKALDSLWLKNNKYIAGENISIADFSAYVEIAQSF